MTAIELRDVKKTFKSRAGTVVAVDGLSLDVEDKGIFGLLGMNGAGKSTAIGICTGLIRPDCGEVKVFGGDINDAKIRRQINVSPQETAVAAALTCAENLSFIARMYGASRAEAKSRANAMIERLKLGDKANERAAKLSGGLKRRLSIGMAVITEPKLVFLDEPTLGLDVVSRRELWRYIKEIAENTAVVLTTHYLEEAEALCGRIAIMSKGKKVAEGTCEQLIEQSGESGFENAFLRLSGEEGYIDV